MAWVSPAPDEADGRSAGATGGTGSPVRGSRRFALVVVVVGVVAFAARAYLLRYAELNGEGTYDDAVHFAGSLALVHGELPYRDFTFLHPPTVFLALAPFAALARLTSEPFGWAAARVAWMLIGAFNATAVARLLRPLGTLSAVVGGLAYALYFPAAYAESTTMLEGLANAFLLGALLLLTRGRSTGRLVAAGILLGLVPTVKIWGVVLVVAALVWLWASRGVRAVFIVGAAAVSSAGAVVLPFLAAAPNRMWTMVVTAQLHRPPMAATLPEVRAWAMLGFGAPPPPAPIVWGVTAVAVAMAGAAGWRARASNLAWLALAMLVSTVGLLAMTPSFYEHYPTVMAAPLALTLGCAVTWPPVAERGSRRFGLVLLMVVLAWAIGQGAHLAGDHTGRSQRFTTLASAVASVSGCVTSDDPAPLIELNLIGRNIERGCPVWIDLTGQFYVDVPPGVVHRADDPHFQDEAIGYLSSGDVAIIGRLASVHYLSPANRRLVRSWPTLAVDGEYTAHKVLRGAPPPDRTPGGRVTRLRGPGRPAADRTPARPPRSSAGSAPAPPG